jgi:hypothetical protein
VPVEMRPVVVKGRPTPVELRLDHTAVVVAPHTTTVAAHTGAHPPAEQPTRPAGCGPPTLHALERVRLGSQLAAVAQLWDELGRETLDAPTLEVLDAAHLQACHRRGMGGMDAISPPVADSCRSRR